MWPPTNVVKEHKRRANFIWVSLVALIIGYSLWLIISTYEKRKNPTVSISIKDERYPYPTISICVTSGEVASGCDSTDYSCAETMQSMIHSPIGFENINGDTYILDTSVTNEAYPYECVDLDLSDMVEIENETGLFPPRLSVLTTWFLHRDLDEVDDQIENSEGALVFFTDPEISNPLASHNMSTFVGIIPFTRQPAGGVPDSFTQTDITMELTESVNLDGTKLKSYSTGTVSSKDYLMPTWETKSSTQDVAVMIVQIWQPSLTHTIRKEVDPLEWAELLGSIGGTWELLLLLWGILFMARSSAEPELKGRNLVKAAQKGARNVVSGATFIVPRVRMNRGPGEYSPSRRNEAIPAWDAPPTTTSNLPTAQALRPPPAYDFSGDQAMNGVAGSRAQTSSNTERSSPSVEGQNRVPSRNIPAMDDIPRPALRPV